MRRRQILFGLVGWAAACAGQTAALEGPVSGVMYDAPSRAIRTVNGIPGAAYLGAAAVSGLDAAWVAPDGEKALVERDGAWFLVTGLRGAEPQWRGLEGLAERPGAVAWSADGRKAAAALTGAIWVLDGENPAAEPRVVGLDGAPGMVTALAVAGETVFAAMAEEAGGGIYRTGAEGVWTLLAAVKGAAKLSLSRDGTLYALDGGTGEIVEFRDAAGEETPAPAVVPAAAGEGAVAARVTADGKRLLVARGGDQPEVVVWDLSAQQEAGRMALDGPPEGLEALPGSPHVLVTQRKKAGDVITILAERAAQLSVFFVPAGE